MGRWQIGATDKVNFAQILEWSKEVPEMSMGREPQVKGTELQRR